MAIIADYGAFVTGVDTHARSHTPAIVDAKSGREFDARRFPLTPSGRGRVAWWLQIYCGTSSGVLVAMEATHSYGATLRELLSSGGYRVIEVPKTVRSLRRSQGKSDQLDAVRAARAVLSLAVDRLTEVKSNPTAQALRILLTARAGMTRERTATINMLLALLRTIDLNHTGFRRGLVLM